MSAELKIRNQSGQFVKGHPGAKPKGAFHKISSEIRDKLSVFLLQRSHELPRIWKKLNDKEKARLFVEIAAFVIPKQKDVAVTHMTEPTAEAVRQLFDFSDEKDVTVWVAEKKKEVFPAKKD